MTLGGVAQTDTERQRRHCTGGRFAQRIGGRISVHGQAAALMKGVSCPGQLPAPHVERTVSKAQCYFCNATSAASAQEIETAKPRRAAAIDYFSSRLVVD
jgi:hypothetical protein